MAQGSNYIRNSVNIVVDMYNGGVSFYIMDPKDRFSTSTGTRSRVLQGFERPFSRLEVHLRYPQDLVAIQAAERLHLPYDRSAGLLQPGRSVGGPGRKV